MAASFPAWFSPSATFNDICDDARWRLIQMRGGCVRVCVFVRARFHSDVCVSHSVRVCVCVWPAHTSSYASGCVIWWGGNKAPTGEFISSPERALNKQLVNQCLHLFFSDKSACVVRWCDSDLQAGVALSSHISSQREWENMPHQPHVSLPRISKLPCAFYSLTAA